MQAGGGLREAGLWYGRLEPVQGRPERWDFGLGHRCSPNAWAIVFPVNIVLEY